MNYLDFYEEHYYTLTKSIHPEVFLAQLRTARILCDMDAEEINNHYVYKNRIQRAGKFIDILKTKGERAFLKFKELLGWEYPHVFETVFIDETPSCAPTGYIIQPASRRSCDLHAIMSEGFDIRNMQGRYNDVMQQMEDLKDLLMYTQHDKKDLEMENQRLRELEVINRHYKEKQRECEKENRQIKEENREFLRKNIQLRDENDSQANRIQELLHEHDKMEKKLASTAADLDRLSEFQNNLQQNFEMERRKSQKLSKECQNLKKTLPRPVNIQNVSNSINDSQQHLKTKIEILQEDNKAVSEQNQDLFEKLEKLQEENYQQQEKIHKLQVTISCLKKEEEKSVQWREKAERKNEDYFKKIQQLQGEKRKVEEEKILSQQNNWDLSEEKNVLFQRKHELERQLEKFQREYDKLKDDIMRERLTTYRKQFAVVQYSQVEENVYPPGASPRQPKASTLPNFTQSDFTSDIKQNKSIHSKSHPLPQLHLDIKSTKQLTKSHSLTTNRGSMIDDDDINDNEDDSLEENYEDAGIFHIDSVLPLDAPYRSLRDGLLVQINLQTLISLEFYLDDGEVNVKEVNNVNSNLQIGDTIVQLRYNTKSGNEVNEMFKDLKSEEEVYKAVETCKQSQPIMIDVFITPGLNTKKKLLDNGGFYIRSNVTSTEPTIRDTYCLPLNEGEIIFVDKNHDDDFWKVHKVNQLTGTKMKVEGLIPKLEEARKIFSSIRSEPSTPVDTPSPNTAGKIFSLGRVGSPLKRKHGIRLKEGEKYSPVSPYIIVLPMKASAKLPVLICGVNSIVSAIIDMLKSSNLDWATVMTERRSWKEMIKEDKHVIVPCSVGLMPSESRYINYCIVLNMVCQQNKINCLQQIFGRRLVDSLESCDISDTYSDSNIHSRSITLDETIPDSKSLTSIFRREISNVQSEMFWIDINSRW